MFFVGVRAIERDAVQVLAKIDAGLVADHVEKDSGVLQYGASLKRLFHNVVVADGVNIDVDDPFCVSGDVLALKRRRMCKSGQQSQCGKGGKKVLHTFAPQSTAGNGG